jgi:hypothetical protein
VGDRTIAGPKKIPSVTKILHRYETILRQLPHADSASLAAELDRVLPPLWQTAYRAMPGSTESLVTVTPEVRETGFCRYQFDHASDDPTQGPERAEDRVAAVWGTSGTEDARTRDKSRIAGFPKGSRASDDRGHFFAHTMGGSVDINLFPQSAKLNRGGLWRQMEIYCAQRPGTFCFVRPIYRDTSWRPAQIEYGIVKTEDGAPPQLWHHLFDN